jgi:hypothetical protein
MNDPSDDALDALLREQFDGPVAADGFTERVMARLPPRRRRFRTWPMAAGIAGGIVTCWLSLRSLPVMDAGWRDWLASAPSASAMTLLFAVSGVSLLAALWALAEAGEPDSSFRQSR